MHKWEMGLEAISSVHIYFWHSTDPISLPSGGRCHQRLMSPSLFPSTSGAAMFQSMVAQRESVGKKGTGAEP